MLSVDAHLFGRAARYAEVMFDQDQEVTSQHFPFKRLLVLGAIIGAGAYYLSREQNRKALDAKLAELGLKDAAQGVSDSVVKSWEKTKEATKGVAKGAGSTLSELSDEAEKALDKAGERAKDVAGDVKKGVDQVTTDTKKMVDKAGEEVRKVTDNLKDIAWDIQSDTKNAADKDADASPSNENK